LVSSLISTLAIIPCTVLAASFERLSGGILMRGDIVNGDFERFSQALAMHGNQTIFLSSDGGLVHVALKIAETIRARGIQTHIPAGQICASACVLIFAGGVIRSASEGARFGVHMGSSVMNNPVANEKIESAYQKSGAKGTAAVASDYEQSAAISTLRQVNFYLAAGVSLRLLEIAAKTKHNDVLWLSEIQAKDFNLINLR
jgi:hypothetical protein